MAKSPTIEKEKGSWLSFFTKLFFFLLVIATVGIMVLSALGGNSDVLKGSIEDYLSARFGGKAQIETFNQMTFYPFLGVDMEGVKVFEGESETKTRFSADKVVMAMGFWDLTFSTGRLKTFNIENLRATPGTIIAQGLHVERAAIIDEGDQAYIRSHGKIAGADYKFETEVDTIGKGSRKKYVFGDIRPFTASLAGIQTKGRIEDLDVDTMSLRDFSIGKEGSSLGGDLDFYYGGENRLTVKGDLDYGQASKARLDILIEGREKTKISGDINFSELLLNDALDYQSILDLSDQIQGILGGKKSSSESYDFKSVDMSLNASIDKLIHNDVTLYSLRTPIKMTNGDLHIGPVQSSFQKSKLKSDIHFKTAKKPAVLDVNLALNNWDYGPLQQAFYGRQDVKGRADIKIDITSQGNNDAELKANLAGNISLIAGQAEFPAATLNFWGKGLVNALLPDFDEQAQTTLNCAIADFTVEEGVAQSNALFLDTMQVTLRGDGDYDIAKDDLDIGLKPKPKSVAIGDITTEIKISGQLSDPSIGPSALGLGKKIGGLALGLINPVFLAYSLTDLGLSENHPCAEFIKAPEEKPVE